MAGGFPEALRRSSARRSRFYDTYLDTVLDRDLGTIARVHDSANVRRLLYAIAAATGSPINVEGISRDLKVTANTIRAHIDLLEMLFLVHRLPAWHTNLLSRLTKAPKLHIIDSGLLAYLLGADARRVVADGRIGGAAIETFGVMEIVRQLPSVPTRRAFSMSAISVAMRWTSYWSAATARSSGSRSRRRLRPARTTFAG